MATQVVAEAFSAGVASAAFRGNPADERWEKSGLMTVLASASPWAGRSIDLSKCAAGSPPPVPQSTDLLGLWPRHEHSGSAQRHGVMSRRPTEFHGSPATRSLRICRHSPVRWRSPAAGRRRLGRVLINPAYPMSAVGAKAAIARTVLHVAEWTQRRHRRAPTGRCCSDCPC